MTEFADRLRREMRGALAEIPVTPPAPGRLMARGERRGARRRIALLIGGLVAVGSLGGTVAIAGDPGNAVSEAAEYFRGAAEDTDQKFGGPAMPADHVLVDSTRLPDGRTVNLWVTDPAAPTRLPDDRCHLLQVVHVNGRQNGSVGSCGGMGDAPVLYRHLEGVLGMPALSQRAAVAVTVSSHTGAARVRVVNGVFLVPYDVAGATKRSFSVEFFDAAGRRIGGTAQVEA